MVSIEWGSLLHLFTLTMDIMIIPVDHWGQSWPELIDDKKMLRLPARRIATGRVRMHEPPGGANPVGQIRLKEDGGSSEETRVKMRRKAC